MPLCMEEQQQDTPGGQQLYNGCISSSIRSSLYAMSGLVTL